MFGYDLSLLLYHTTKCSSMCLYHLYPVLFLVSSVTNYFFPDFYLSTYHLSYFNKLILYLFYSLTMLYYCHQQIGNLNQRNRKFNNIHIHLMFINDMGNVTTCHNQNIQPSIVSLFIFDKLVTYLQTIVTICDRVTNWDSTSVTNWVTY